MSEGPQYDQGFERGYAKGQGKRSDDDDGNDRLVRIETKLDMLLGLDHEKRIRAVENKQWLFTGGAISLSWIGTYLMKKAGI